MKRITIIRASLFLVAICLTMVACNSTSKQDSVTTESQELYRIQVGGKCGFINEYGKLMIEPQFDRAYWFFGDGVCYAEIGERKGLINTDGEFVVELDNSINWVSKSQNDVSVFHTKNGKQGIINILGEVVLPATFKTVIRDESNGFIVEDTLGNQGYVNYQGEFIVPCKYDEIHSVNEGLMVVATNNKFGYMDTTGVWVIDTVYNDARDFGDGLARVKIGEKWQFINHEGIIDERFNYDEVFTGFSCNRAFVKNGNAIELIDTSGTQIAVVEVDSVYGFSEGFATFKKNGKYGKIDTVGNIVIQSMYEKLSHTMNGLSVFEKKGKQGLIDNNGNVIVNAIHEKFLRKTGCSLLQFADDNWTRGTYYDREGNLIWKDMSVNSYQLPDTPTKEDWKCFFDAKLSEMNPIEGIYYVTFNEMAVDRENDHASSNGSSSGFYAVVRSSENHNEYNAFSIDERKISQYWKNCWVKKFVSIGETNAYAIVNRSEKSMWAEDGKLVLEDPYKFNVTLRQGGNDYYNWYVQCEFIKDYPSTEMFDQVQQPEWTGTGFAIADGFVATNYHVTNGAKTIKIRGVNGDMKKAYKAFVVASDRDHDLAIIRIMDKSFNAFGDIPYRIGKSIPEVGDDIFVLGYPMTNTMGQEVKITDGIISAASGFKSDQSMYQISAAVQPGNSGGPLFDKEGNVIGIICAKHADAENANYAIKVSYLYSLVNSSGLGIKMSDNNKVKSKSLSQKVKQVKPYVYLIECSSH